MSDTWDDDGDDPDDLVPPEWKDLEHALRAAANPERLGWAQADMAMRLMRDRPLAQVIAAEAPAGPERVALAVGVGALPPHIIVGRASGGYFATVLGHDMIVKSGTPVVGFDRVRMHIERADLLAARTSRAAEFWKDRAGVRQLIQRCDLAGARLAREDFEQLAALAPILEAKYLEKATEAFGRVRRAAPHIVRLKRIPPPIERKLFAFWNRFHAVGNYTLLASVRGKESFSILDRAEVSQSLQSMNFEPIRHLFYQSLTLGQGYVALRVFGALARAGEAAVPVVKDMMANAVHAIGWLFGAYALVAVGRRHRKLRGELARAIGPSKMPDVMRQLGDADGAARVLQSTLEGMWCEADDDEDAAMCRLAGAIAGGIRDPDEMAAIPVDDLAFARLASMKCNFLDAQQDVSTMSIAVGLCAEVPPEQLYFPAASASLAPGFSTEAAIQYARFVGPPPQPVRAVEKPGRNDPCSCGSGQKYKRCCGLK